MPTKTSNSKSAWSAKDIYDMIFSTYGNAHVNANKARAKEASKYMIPYIPEKEIMLTTGRYNTGKISTNLLDSIYNASQRTGVPLDIALGLAGRESTLGIGRGFKKGKSVSGTDLYSNWQQIQTIPNNKAQIKKWNSLLGRTDLTDEDYDFKSEFLIRAQDSLENTKPLDENPIDNALKFYQTGKYNPGDSRHTQMVEDDAKVLMSDPAIQKWLKTKTDSQMKCGGRRTAQLGLDIREGGIAIPIANNMFYIDGRKHAAGGVAIGPNNKNGVEVEGGEVVEMIDSNHPSIGRQFKAGGQQQTMRVFSSVPFLRGASPAELVLGGANPNAVFKAQEEFKDKNRINDDGTTYEMGGEGKPRPKRSRPVTGVLPYGYTIRNLYSVENPYHKGIKGNVAKMYDNRTLGAGVDVVSGHPELYKKAKSGRIPKKQADETAVIHLRKDDNAIRSNYADVYGKAAADTLSYGPRFLVAQARYQQGNIRKAWPAIHKAMAKGNAKALKKAVLQVTPKDHTYRRQWIEDFKVYKAGGIYIKPSKRGTFTAAATKHGMGVQEFASKVLANKEDYSPAMVKKANFARNASRWKKEYGGDDTKTAALKRLRNKFTIAGDYDGGMFGGAGAGSVIMPQPEYVTDTITKRYLVPVTQNFNDAFRDARNSGKTEFMFDGKLYNTNLGDNPNNNTAGFNRTSTIIVPIEYKEIRRRKKEFGGSMIYTINGNVKTGLNLRPKAKYGTIDKKDKDVKVGQDGLIYKRAADGEWYTDGTVHVAYKPITKSSREDLYYANPVQGLYHDAYDGNFANVSSIVPDEYEIITRKFDKPKRTYVGGYDEEEKETKKIGSLTYEKNESGQWVPSKKQSVTTTRDGGRPKDFGMTRTGVNHPNGNYKYHPLTGEKINEIGVVETSEPSVKGTTKVTSKPSSTPRGGETKASASKATSQSTPSIQDTVNKITMDAWKASKTPKIDLSKAKMPSYDISGLGSKETKAAKAKLNTSSTGGGTQSKDGRWVGQYKTTNVGDWIGLGSNLAGTIASYFMTKNAINKMPEPIKPVMAQAAKLKTRYNVEPQLSEIREAEQMNRAAVRRNTQSSNTSLAQEQRLMNEARGARNTLYGQKENIETQLINQDRLNRQSVMKDNVRAYNEYLNRLTATKMAQNEMRVSNVNNLISGLTGSVNSILGNIESRKTTNNTLRVIAAANPNVDARLIGGFDYYIDPITKKKYNKNQQYVGTING